MVSPEAMKDLKAALEGLGSAFVDINSYSGELLAAAFDVYTTDTFIAGIADKIISGHMISDVDRAILAKPLIFDRVFWITSSGQTIDIKDDPLLLDLAQKVELLREKCAIIANETKQI